MLKLLCKILRIETVETKILLAIRKEIMTALTDLNDAIAKLSVDVTAEVSALAAAIAKQGGTADADVEAAVANLKALSAQLEASVAPPVAAPAPTPTTPAATPAA